MRVLPFYMIKIGGTDLLKEFDLDDALSKVGGTIELCACVHSVKQMSGFAFVLLRTARYVIQSVYSEAFLDNLEHLARIVCNKQSRSLCDFFRVILPMRT